MNEFNFVKHLEQCLPHRKYYLLLALIITIIREKAKP